MQYDHFNIILNIISILKTTNKKSTLNMKNVAFYLISSMICMIKF